mgnify:CR=1 FL=1
MPDLGLGDGMDCHALKSHTQKKNTVLTKWLKMDKMELAKTAVRYAELITAVQTF